MEQLSLDVKRAAIYLRISLDKDGDERAVDRQRKDAVALAAQRAWEVVEVYTDNSLSASKREIERPDYNRMLADYRAGRFEVLICYDLDRLTRQPRQLEDWIEEAEKRGLAIHTLNGEADLTTEAGRLFARIKAAVARSEIERKGQRQRDANRQRAEKGVWQFSRRPFGFRRTAGRVVQVAEECTAIREAFGAYLAGKSYQWIADDWNSKGRPTTLGKRWQPVQIMQLMRNPRLAGIVVYRGQEMPDVEPTWEPVIDRRTWSDFCEVKRGRKQSGSPSAGKPKHLASGFAICGVCGDRLYSTYAQRPRKQDGTRSKYRVYDCTKNRCVSIAAEPFEGFIETLVLARLSDKRIIRALRTTPNTAPLSTEIAELSRNRGNIVDLLRDGTLSPQEVRQQLNELKDRIEYLQARLNAMRRESPLTDLAMGRSIEPRWRELGVVDKRRIINDLGIVIKVRRGQRGVVFRDASGNRTINPSRLEIAWLDGSAV